MTSSDEILLEQYARSPLTLSSKELDRIDGLLSLDQEAPRIVEFFTNLYQSDEKSGQEATGKLDAFVRNVSSHPRIITLKPASDLEKDPKTGILKPIVLAAASETKKRIQRITNVFSESAGTSGRFLYDSESNNGLFFLRSRHRRNFDNAFVTISRSGLQFVTDENGEAIISDLSPESAAADKSSGAVVRPYLDRFEFTGGIAAESPGNHVGENGSLSFECIDGAFLVTYLSLDSREHSAEYLIINAGDVCDIIRADGTSFRLASSVASKDVRIFLYG